MSGALHPVIDKKVLIDTVRLISFNTATQKLVSDLRPFLNRIELYENIFSPYLSGQIYFRDGISITNITPMVGFEDIIIQFSNYDKEQNVLRTYGPYTFSVYSVNDRAPNNQGTENLRFDIVSKELLTSFTSKLSCTYKNKKPEEIIQDIVSVTLGSKKPFKHIQKTGEPLNFTIPYLTAFDAIKMLTLQGISDNNHSNYVFFETLDGYYYVSLQELIRLASTDKEIPTIYNDLAGYRDIGNTKTFIKAEELTVIRDFNIFKAIKHGYFASTTYALDVLSGVCEVIISGTHVGDDYDNRYKLNNNGIDFYPNAGKLLGITPTSRTFVIPSTHITSKNPEFAKDNSVTNNFLAQSLAKKNRELLGMSTRVIRGKLPGVPELHAGKIINVVFPTLLNNDSGNMKRRQDIANGRYLITHVCHTIIADGHGKFLYETTFDASSDSFKQS